MLQGTTFPWCDQQEETDWRCGDEVLGLEAEVHGASEEATGTSQETNEPPPKKHKGPVSKLLGDLFKEQQQTESDVHVQFVDSALKELEMYKADRTHTYRFESKHIQNKIVSCCASKQPSNKEALKWCLLNFFIRYVITPFFLALQQF